MGQKAKAMDLKAGLEAFKTLDEGTGRTVNRRQEALAALHLRLERGESTGNLIDDYVARWHEGDVEFNRKLCTLDRELRARKGQLVLFVEYGETRQLSDCVWLLGLLDGRGLVTRSRNIPGAKSSPLEIGVSLLANEHESWKGDAHPFVRTEKHELLVSAIREDKLQAARSEEAKHLQVNLIIGSDAVIAWFMRPQVPYNVFTGGADVNLARAVGRLGKAVSDIPALHNWLIKRRKEHVKQLAWLSECWIMALKHVMSAAYLDEVAREEEATERARPEEPFDFHTTVIGGDGPLSEPKPSAEELVAGMRKAEYDLWQYVTMCERIGIEKEPVYLEAQRLLALTSKKTQ